VISFLKNKIKNKRFSGKNKNKEIHSNLVTYILKNVKVQLYGYGLHPLMINPIIFLGKVLLMLHSWLFVAKT